MHRRRQKYSSRAAFLEQANFAFDRSRARGDEEDSHLGDFIEDKNPILPIDAAIQSNLRETTTRVLASVTLREERCCACASASG